MVPDLNSSGIDPKNMSLKAQLLGLILVRPMHAISVYRALLLVRVGWLLLEWFFGWDARRHVSFTLLHPYASLFAHAAAEFILLVILIGLWYFRRWARLLFVLALVLSIVDAAFWPYHLLS